MSAVALQVRCFLSPTVVKGGDICALGNRGPGFQQPFVLWWLLRAYKERIQSAPLYEQGLPLWAGILHMSWHRSLS